MGEAAAKSRRPFGPLLVRAVVRDIKTDVVVAEHDFDFNSKEKRQWFNEKLLVWAFLNKNEAGEHKALSVEIMAASDDAG